MHSRAALPADELVGEPRLFPEAKEQELLQRAPFRALREAIASDLKMGSAHTRKKTNLDDWRPGVAQDLSKDHNAISEIHDWVFFCTAVKLSDEGAADLFVTTIDARNTGREYEALRSVIRAQMNYYKVCLYICCLLHSATQLLSRV